MMEFDQHTCEKLHEYLIEAYKISYGFCLMFNDEDHIAAVSMFMRVAPEKIRDEILIKVLFND